MVQSWISTQCIEKQITEFLDVGPTGIEPATYGSLQLQTYIIRESV